MCTRTGTVTNGMIERRGRSFPCERGKVMAAQTNPGGNEGLRMLDEFICDAIPGDARNEGRILMSPSSRSSKDRVNKPTDERPMTVPDFLSAKARGVRLTLLTAYDYTMARLLDAAGVDGLLV